MNYFKGNTGLRGDKGDKGNDGPRGFLGLTGPIGATGEQGVRSDEILTIIQLFVCSRLVFEDLQDRQ